MPAADCLSETCEKLLKFSHEQILFFSVVEIRIKLCIIKSHHYANTVSTKKEFSSPSTCSDVD